MTSTLDRFLNSIEERHAYVVALVRGKRGRLYLGDSGRLVASAYRAATFDTSEEAKQAAQDASHNLGEWLNQGRLCVARLSD